MTIGATNQGMVAGDLVNTASRIQGVAPPGSVVILQDLVRLGAYERLSIADRKVRHLAAASNMSKETLALAKRALDVALDHDLADTALRASRTLAFLAGARDRYPEALSYHEQALDLARKVGDRRQEWRTLSEMTTTLCSMGRWDEALRRSAEIPEFLERVRRAGLGTR